MTAAPAAATEPRRFRAGDNGLTAGMAAAFDAEGYLLIEDFVSAADCDRLRAQAEDLVAAFDAEAQATVFSTISRRHAADSYFQQSGDKIRIFFEEEAFDDAGRLKQPKALSINKIGHAMHDLDPVFSAFSRQPRLKRIAADLFADPLLLQSMYIFKQPGIGGEVSWHQDSTYLYTEPLSCIGFWFALEDATVDNGAMHAIPGGHRGPLRQRFRRRDGALAIETVDPTGWPEAPRIALEAKRGTMIALHGLLPHCSGPNRSARSRHAFTLHVIDGACRYPADNWLRRSPDLPLRGF